VVPEDIAESQIIESWLAARRGTRVKITVPRRGPKRQLIQVAIENAAETLRTLQAWRATEADKAEEAIADLQTALDLPRPPRRIECYDISNLMGTHTVGSMVVFEDGAPRRADYRRFKVREAAAGDDFGAIREVLGRRFRRLEEHRRNPSDAAPGAFEQSPDLVLIDGGKGQLAVGIEVLSGLGMDDIPLASLAKREEELFRPGRGDAIQLPRGTGALHLVQRVRDEAHRFAVSYHRTLRRKAGLASTLDDVPGIGAKRRRALLQIFGSLDKIRDASTDELARVPGMNRAAAELIKAYL
jgi:excinuclease ABC subunit C